MTKSTRYYFSMRKAWVKQNPSVGGFQLSCVCNVVIMWAGSIPGRAKLRLPVFGWNDKVND